MSAPTATGTVVVRGEFAALDRLALKLANALGLDTPVLGIRLRHDFASREHTLVICSPTNQEPSAMADQPGWRERVIEKLFREREATVQLHTATIQEIDIAIKAHQDALDKEHDAKAAGKTP